ncbi:GNAT family N-acetyltransferase [Chryseobacterium sp. ISL-6]|uniref:GNAT family N-acetyltransferase n=1 Tax=Chryseobacterium sp. ISL-6 TaxID=2819143 RepID=UPI001BE70DE0|nr:GNAT family N-acetyltransferase [Chryseobacterium sp. ISL-6]MBT2619510.1 GNAT family N-acetyltransferase [Chryseobacterium sp. ISL-6]
MEKTLEQQTKFAKKAQEITARILLNGMFRELGNGKFYEGIPKYDTLTAKALQNTNYPLYLRFDLKKSELFLFAPVSYRSESSFHDYGFPIWAVDHKNQKVFEVDLDQLTAFVYKEFSESFNEKGFDKFIDRIHSSLKNMELTIAANSQNNKTSAYSFLESEQQLPIGHNLHPFTKSRMGFSEGEQLHYGPEFGKAIQLEYFLIDKHSVRENSVLEISCKELLKSMVSLPENIRKEYLKDGEMLSDFYIAPCHPWEGKYFLSTKEGEEMVQLRKLIPIGALGDEFYSTSSIRTLYNLDSAWMPKFSLHVLMTGSIRINSFKDLKRGYASSLWWKTVAHSFEKNFSHFKLLLEPASLSVHHNGKNIESLNLLLRENTFKPEDKVLLLARLCQDEPTDESSFVQRFFKDVADRLETTKEEAISVWFEAYIKLLIAPLNHLYSQYGMAPEAHQQNLLIGLNDNLLPETLFVRDGQGYLLRESARYQYEDLLKDHIEIEELFIRDERLLDIISHHLLVSNLSALITSLGKTGWVKERDLIDKVYKEFVKLNHEDPSDITRYALTNRYWGTKANLQSAILDMDGGINASSLSYARVPNLLHKHFFSDQLINPKGKEVFFRRYFEKEDVTITMRPIDLDEDLEMLHEWFNREHAVKVWQMNWPIDELETYYRLMLPSEEGHSYIVLSNGEPSCNIEVYWPCRDIVGDYYEVLPTDYGTHQFIAPTDPKKKYVSPSTQSMVDYVFAQSEVGKMVGEGSVDSLASMMNKAHVGFKVEKVIEMPHKKANLNFCYREWYWEKFPQNKDVQINATITENE